MTWRTNIGERTLTGAEAELVRQSLAYMADMIVEEIAGYADPWTYGVVLFDRLDPPARLALLADVGWALLRETETCPKLTAINESAVAAIYRNLEQCIQFELDSEGYSEPDHAHFWRKRVLEVFRKSGDTEELPTETCDDWGEWGILAEILADRVLWDDDFDDADRYLDAPPDTARFLRGLMSIDDDYYRAIPPDPLPADLPRIRSIIQELCSD